MNIDLYAELGKMKYSHTLQSLECGEGYMLITQNYFDNRYHPVNNPDGIYATPNMGNYSNTRKQAATSNMFFKDASYLSLRSLKFYYNLPDASSKLPVKITPSQRTMSMLCTAIQMLAKRYSLNQRVCTRLMQN